MRPQVGLLTNLRQLGLLDPPVGDEGACILEQLSGITALCVSGYGSRPPSCLSRLTQLRSLHLSCHPEEEFLSGADAEALCAALPALQQLTHLSLEHTLERPPSALTSLRRLHSFGFLNCRRLPADAHLPAGPYLATLQRLAGDCSFLGASLPALSASASQLQELGVLCVLESEQQAALSILRWAAGRPSMRTVRLEYLHGGSMQQAAEDLARQHPRLSLQAYKRREEWADIQDWERVFPDLPRVPREP